MEREMEKERKKRMELEDQLSPSLSSSVSLPPNNLLVFNKIGSIVKEEEEGGGGKGKEGKEKVKKKRLELPSLQTRFGLKKNTTKNEEKKKKKKKKKKNNETSMSVPEKIERQALNRSYGDTSVLEQTKKMIDEQQYRH